MRTGQPIGIKFGRGRWRSNALGLGLNLHPVAESLFRGVAEETVRAIGGIEAMTAERDRGRFLFRGQSMVSVGWLWPQAKAYGWMGRFARSHRELGQTSLAPNSGVAVTFSDGG